MTTTYAPGSVISVRNRLWRVDGQPEEDVLVASTIDGGEMQQMTFYAPLEAIKPGRLAPPAPDTMGTIQAQDLLLRAYRLSMLHGTAPLLSLQRSRVIPKDYQLVPVVMSLEMPRVRMLLADDVGLGKTIEAGLIATELLARQMAKRILVIVPASLREQWREALDYFFHIPARIISTRHRREMERELPAGANPWGTYACLITSVDYAKQAAIKNQILEQAWDLVIIDEAHQVAKPHQNSPDQSVHMDRWDLATALAESDRVRHLLLLTATPHDGYTDTFASLLRMLDVGAVKGPPHAPQILREMATRYVCQRRREDVETWFEEEVARGRAVSSPFPERDQDEVIVAPTVYEMDAIRAVQDYGEQVLAQASVGSTQARTLAHWTVLHFHKRALSSPEALRCSLRNRRNRLQDQLRARLGREADPYADLPLPVDVAKANVLDADTGERLSDEEVSARTERLVYGTPAQIRLELDAVDGVLAKTNKVTPSRDNKLQKLLDVVLPDLMRLDPKVVIFTRYVDTMTYLNDQITGDDRFGDFKVLTIQGSLNERQRRTTFRDFERAPKAILVATDAISEGINLQHAAAQVIHYELPWNPNRLEQRNGRVDRFGQRKPVVTIRTMVMDETLDAAILKVLVEKAARIRKDYGFSPPYFSDDTSILDLLTQHEVTLGPKQLTLFDAAGATARQAHDAGATDVDHDPFSDETLNRIKSDSFYGQTHITLPEIEARLAETAATVGSPEAIKAFVFSGLSRFGCDHSANADGSYRLTITEPALQTASAQLTGSAGSAIPRATFDAEWALDNPDATLLDVGHPLVRRLIEEVKQHAFRSERTGDTNRHYGRAAALVTPDVTQVTALIHILARYVVNTAPTSIIEELLPVGVRVYSEQPSTVSYEQAITLAAATPSSARWSQADVKEALADALAIPGLNGLLADAVEDRRATLVTERSAMAEQMQGQAADNGRDQPATWLDGIDDLARGTFDLLTITLLLPA